MQVARVCTLVPCLTVEQHLPAARGEQVGQVGDGAAAARAPGAGRLPHEGRPRAHPLRRALRPERGARAAARRRRQLRLRHARTLVQRLLLSSAECWLRQQQQQHT